ncbi:MAG: hypothetical protein OXO49_00865 [Gammaproteobacteria bacterium]|nr:hypothetical protein [Gammaproteobacteria bacterium]MDE0252942.1 hypothetical protein [Gammaproteobacteria bacterium]MDE0402045.1 hypothetical protein [Gammaproteobacteria bacterium]
MKQLNLLIEEYLAENSIHRAVPKQWSQQLNGVPEREQSVHMVNIASFAKPTLTDIKMWHSNAKKLANNLSNAVKKTYIVYLI